MDDGLARVVAELHMIHGHFPFHFVHSDRVGSVRGFGFFVDQTENTLGSGAGRLQFADDVGDLVDGAGEFPGVQHEGGQIADGKMAPQEQDRPEDAHKGQGQVVDKVHGGAGHAAVVIGVVVGVHRGVIPLVEPGDHGLLLVVCLGGFLPGDNFFHKAVELAQFYGTLMEQGADFLGHVPGKPNGHGDGDGENQHQHRGNDDHHDQGAQHGDDAGSDLQKVVGQRSVHRVDVVGNAADNVAGLMAVKVAHRQFGKAVEHLLAHLEHDLLAELDHEDGQDVG